VIGMTKFDDRSTTDFDSEQQFITEEYMQAYGREAQTNDVETSSTSLTEEPTSVVESATSTGYADVFGTPDFMTTQRSVANDAVSSARRSEHEVKLCRFFSQRGACKLDADCRFAHITKDTYQEYRRAYRVRRRLGIQSEGVGCLDFLCGHCPRGDKCPWPHFLEVSARIELRRAMRQRGSTTSVSAR
jgi:hypothetical protein